MVYEVPVSKKSLKQNRFEFTLPGSKKVHSIPLLKFVKPSFIRDYADLEETEFIIKFLDDTIPGVLDGLDDLEQLTGLFTAWQEASGISVGESEASPE
jgi:hypothetical protein